jgi:uncharacterized protein (TIGR02466 family)
MKLFHLLFVLLLLLVSLAQSRGPKQHEHEKGDEGDEEYDDEENYDDENEESYETFTDDSLFTFELSADGTASETFAATSTATDNKPIVPTAAGGRTFGQRWVARENSKRNMYYKKKSIKLWNDVKSAVAKEKNGEDVSDPFLIVWDLLNTLVAIIELEPHQAHSWIFAGHMSLHLLITSEISENDVIGFFAQAMHLSPYESSKHIVTLLTDIKKKANQDSTLELLDELLDLFSDPTKLPKIPRDSKTYGLLSSKKHPGVRKALEHLELKKTIGGKGAVEPGDQIEPEEIEPPPATSLSTDTTASRNMREQMKKIDLWPTHLVSINLMKILNVTKEDNAYLSNLAVNEFLKYKKTREDESKNSGEPPPTPNDLDDGFFSHQIASPGMIFSNENSVQGKWPELYTHGTKGYHIYKRLVLGIREACENYIRMYGRPGTLEHIKSKGELREDFWSAVYIPDTVHSHHVHQASIVSAVYYSKVGAENTPIVFSDPRGAGPIHNYEQFLGEHDFEPEAPFHQQYNYFPEEGELILFPSWLVHKVPAHKGKDDRVSWPYNYNSADLNFDAWSRTV